LIGVFFPGLSLRLLMNANWYSLHLSALGNSFCASLSDDSE
jgi:hypothetical protein